jgi:hypothetical protein
MDQIKKITHPVNVINELNENIIGIDFILAPKLTYDVIARQVKIAGAGANSIAALKYLFTQDSNDLRDAINHCN